MLINGHATDCVFLYLLLIRNHPLLDLWNLYFICSNAKLKTNRESYISVFKGMMKKQSASSSCFLFLILVALILCSHQTPEERKRSRKMTCMNVKLHHWQSPTQPIISAVVWNICSNVSVTDVGRRTISRASAQRVDPPYRCDGACCVLLTATIRLNMIYPASVCLFIKDVKWRESCHVNSHMTNIWRRPHLPWFALLYICHVSDVYSSNYRALCKLGPQNLSERKAGSSTNTCIHHAIQMCTKAVGVLFSQGKLYS